MGLTGRTKRFGMMQMCRGRSVFNFDVDGRKRKQQRGGHLMVTE
jgi:hypothetical protein